ncbi:MAG: carbon-nitrogen hydrolase family protein, partial [Myxococcales bacterium]|nr:carbon-nitrogen hydrolase family protein [Myxococcales bacterium]
MESIRVAAVQMTSGQDVAENLDRAREAIAEAAAMGADWVALPENFAYLRGEGTGFPCAQSLEGEIVGFLRERARQHSVYVLGGSFPEQAP